MNDYLLYIRKAVISFTSQVYLVQWSTHAYAHTPPVAFCIVQHTVSFYTGDILTVVTSVCFTEEAELTYQMVSRNVFYYRRECVTEDLDGFSCLFWLWHFPCTQPWESWSKRVLFPALCTAPLCSTSLTGESENETGTNTPLLTMKYVLATVKFSQNRPGCVMARRRWAGRELQEPFRLQRCVLHFPWGAETTGLWVFSIILV